MPVPTIYEETFDTVYSEGTDLEKVFGRARGSLLETYRQTPKYKMQLVTAAKVMADVLEGKRSIERLREAMSTSDFPIAFADIISRSILTTYNNWPVTWPAVAKKVLVRDFRDNKLFLPMLGGDARLGNVPEGTNYPEVSLTEQTPVTFNVAKFGRRMAFTFESWINDDLDFLRDMPERLGRGARRTEEREVTDQYVDANGPHASLYTSSTNLVVTGLGASADNPELSIAGLQDAMTVLASMTDESGEPIMIETVTLVVPPALEVRARNILSATELRFGTIAPGATSGTQQELSTANWMRNRVNLQVNPYIPIVASGSAVKNSMWFLFADPRVGRPAILAAFLRGHDQPQILIKEPNARTPGGGAISPLEGDFDSDSIQYRVRHIMGTKRIDYRATVASKGTNAA